MVNAKIVIVGTHGMLGSMLSQVLAEYEPILLDHTQIDITNQTQVVEKITVLHPDIIINAAAYTAVDNCETNFELAKLVNGAAAGYLAGAAKKINAKFIHYSTDYIFAGDKQDGYKEDYSVLSPVNRYGESKLLGEQAIQSQVDSTWNKFYIIRTAWLYGPNGKNFVDTMLQLSKTRSELIVVNDQHGSPTFTKDLAEQTRYLIEHDLPGGIYHATNSGTCTWYEFAQEIFHLANIAVNVLPCTTTDFPRPAKRPAYSILLNTKLPQLRSWQEGLRDYLDHYYNPNA